MLDRCRVELGDRELDLSSGSLRSDRRPAPGRAGARSSSELVGTEGVADSVHGPDHVCPHLRAQRTALRRG